LQVLRIEIFIDKMVQALFYQHLKNLDYLLKDL